MIPDIGVLWPQLGARGHEVGTVDQHPVVGVGQVRGRRHQQGHVGSACARGGPDEERHTVVAGIAAHPEGVDAARKILWQRRLDGGLPAGVVLVVVMEVDGVVVRWIVGPPVSRPVPCGSGDPTGRQLVQHERSDGPFAGRHCATGHVGAEIPASGGLAALQHRSRDAAVESFAAAAGSQPQLIGSEPLQLGAVRTQGCRCSYAMIGVQDPTRRQITSWICR